MAATRSDGKRLAIFAAGGFLLLFAWLVPLPTPHEVAGRSIALTEGGKLSLGVLALVVLFWVTEVMPFAVTGFLAIVLIHALGIQEFNQTLAKGFGHPVTAFVIGVFLLSLAVTKTGLGARLAGLLLRRVGRNPRGIIFAFLAAGAVLAAGISDGAVAAILLPLAVGVLRAEGVEPLRSNFGKALMMACAWGPSVGGISTPAGTASNAISLSYLQQMGGVERGFVDWLLLGGPAAIVLLPVAWLILVWLFPPEMERLERSPEFARVNRDRSALTRGEWTTIAVLALTLGCWIAGPAVKQLTGITLSIEYVAFAAVLLFFVPKLDVLTWDDVHREFPWGALFLVMTGVAVGFVVGDSGVAEWLSYSLIRQLGTLPLYVSIVGTALAVCLLHNFFVSNTVTTVVLVPIVLHAARLLEMPPWLAVAPAAFLSTMGLVLVTTAPTNMIPYTAGYFSIRDFARAGIVMSLAGSFVIGSVIYLMHVLFGIT
ncbi:MAG: DASS family sodium-coupled anion symporter [Opitutaceae bacterium]|nr:DASS family sodium-coupled anion symporter [Opitutaceae bacterium]